MSVKNFVLFGDFSYPANDWQNKSVSGQDAAEAELFLDCVDDCFYTQHIREATRESNVLYLILSSNPDIVSDIQIMDKLNTTDHNMISVKLNFQISGGYVTKQRYDYNEANWKCLKQELSQVNWDSMLDKGNLDSWNKFKRVLHDLEVKYVSIKSITVNNSKGKPIWMTYKISKLIRKENSQKI